MYKQLRHQNWFWIGKNEHKMTILIGKNMIQNYAAAKLGPQEEFILLASVPNSFWIFIFFSDFCLDWGLSISSRLFCHWLFVAGPFSWTQFCKNCLHGICMSKTLLWWVCCPLASSGVLWGPMGSTGVLWRLLASSGVLYLTFWDHLDLTQHGWGFMIVTSWILEVWQQHSVYNYMHFCTTPCVKRKSVVFFFVVVVDHFLWAQFCKNCLNGIFLVFYRFSKTLLIIFLEVFWNQFC